MGKDLESTMKWKVDVNQFKSAIRDANTSIKLANSEFKKAAAGMDDWSKSEAGLIAKMKQLSSVADAQQRKVDVLRQLYEETAKSQGENSEAAKKLKIQLNNQEAALAATERELKDNVEQQERLGTAEKDTSEDTKGASFSFEVLRRAMVNLVADGIKKVISELGKLKEAYQEYDAGLDNVITKTGATGETLAELSSSYDKVQHSVLASSEDIGDAIGEVNTRFGYTGEELEDLSEMFLKFAKINGTNVSNSVDKVQKTLAAFGLEGKDAGRVLDALTLTGQKTGVSVDKLTDGLIKNTTAFKQMGLSLEDAIVLMGQAEVSGADMEVIMNGVSRAMKKSAEEGVPLADVLTEIEDEIRNNSNETEALALAYDYFGKSGDKVFSAIKSGTLTFQGLRGSAEDATGAVERTYEATLDGADEMKLILQGIKADIGKDISQFLKENKAAIKAFIEGVISFIKNVVNFIIQNKNVVIGALAGIATALAATFAVSKVTAFFNALKAGEGILTALGGGLTKVLVVGAGMAIGALVGLYSATHKSAEELYGLTEEQKAYNEAIKEQANAWNETAKARTEAISGIDSEIEYNQELWQKLQGLVDENGRVKEGCEQRAATITDILAKAMGIEIDLINGQISNYKELKATMQDVIAVKKAEAYLAADEQAFAEAVKGKKDAYMELVQAQRNAHISSDRLRMAQSELDAVTKGLETGMYGSVTAYTEAKKKQQELTDKVNVLKAAYNEQNATLEAAQARYDGYMTTIANHEGLMAAIESGEVEPMTEAMYKLGESYGTAATMSEASLKQQEARLKQTISDMRTDIQKGGTLYTADQLAIYERMYAQTQTELGKIEQAHSTSGRQAPRNYQTSYEEAMAPAISSASWFAGQISGAMDSVADGAYSSGSNAGTWFTSGLQSGIESGQGAIFRAITTLGTTMLGKMKASLKEESPSKATKEMGEFLMEGLDIGMKTGSRAVFASAGNIGDSLISSLRRDVNGSVRGLQTAGAASGGGSVVFNQYNSSPKALDATTIYRQTNSILFKARLRNG